MELWDKQADTVMEGKEKERFKARLRSPLDRLSEFSLKNNTCLQPGAFHTRALPLYLNQKPHCVRLR